MVGLMARQEKEKSMKSGWFVYGGEGHLVWYMGRQGAAVGVPDRHFFLTPHEAEQAARRFGWRNYGVAWSCASEAPQ
jgi:hypothetical protein